MVYYEYLRTRRSLTVYTIIVVALAATIYAVTAFHTKGVILHFDRPWANFHGVPFILFSSLAAWATAILASTMATSLNRQHDHLAYSWTRPQDRAVMATSIVSLDLLVLAAAFVVALAASMACFFGLFGSQLPILWNNMGTALIRAFGFGIMWYAIVQGVSAAMRVRGGTIAGIAWPVFIVAALLESARFPEPWNAILTVLNIFNPMAYLSGTEVTRHGDVILNSIIPFTEPVRWALMYGISLIALVIAVNTWKRMEA